MFSIKYSPDLFFPSEATGTASLYARQNAEGAANDAEFHKALADEGLRDARKDLAECDKGPVR